MRPNNTAVALWCWAKWSNLLTMVIIIWWQYAYYADVGKSDQSYYASYLCLKWLDWLSQQHLVVVLFSIKFRKVNLMVAIYLQRNFECKFHGNPSHSIVVKLFHPIWCQYKENEGKWRNKDDPIGSPGRRLLLSRQRRHPRWSRQVIKRRTMFSLWVQEAGRWAGHWESRRTHYMAYTQMLKDNGCDVCEMKNT